MEVKALRIIRPLNCFLASTLVASFAFFNSGFSNVFLLSFLVPFLITGAGNTINDYFDVEVDRRTGKDRPLVKKELKRGEALWLAVIMFVIGMTLSYFINLKFFFLASLAFFLLILYSKKSKEIGILGNLIISFLVASLFYAGSLIGGKTYIFLPISVFSFNLSRELIKDMQDTKGDEVKGKGTFPLEYGLKKTKILSSVLLLVSLILLFFSNLDLKTLFLLVSTPLMVMMAWKSNGGKFKTSQKIGKVIMITLVILVYVGFLVE